MKKKIVAMMLVGMMAVSMTACGCEESKQEVNQEAQAGEKVAEKEGKAEESKRDFVSGDYSDLGNGAFSIQTAGGDSADGTVPALFVSEEDMLVQIGYSAEGMDGNHLSYIYIDGMETAREQLGEMAQGVLDLQGDSLLKGEHVVEVVQFDTDEPSGEVITYKSCKYEVK